MLMANVFYTLSGAASLTGGILSKARAGRLLAKAKYWATKAFLTEAGVKDVRTAVTIIGVKLPKNKSQIGYGDMHILMSCYVQWATHFKRRFHLPHGHDLSIVEDCHYELRRAPSENLRMIAAAMLYDVFRNEEESNATEDAYIQMKQFLKAKVPGLLKEREASIPDIELVQTVCRVARVLDQQELALKLATMYGLGDQLQKARDRE